MFRSSQRLRRVIPKWFHSIDWRSI